MDAPRAPCEVVLQSPVPATGRADHRRSASRRHLAAHHGLRRGELSRDGRHLSRDRSRKAPRLRHGRRRWLPRIDPQRPDSVPLVSVTFDDAPDNSTEMTLTLVLPSTMSDEEAKRWSEFPMRDGWGDTIDR